MVAGISKHWTVAKSKLSLAVLQDSGWYDVDYAAADAFFRGAGAGCGFAMERCDAGSRHWCDDAGGTEYCTFDRKAKGVCELVRFQAPLAPEFQHFADPSVGGPDVLVEHCPVVVPVQTQDGARSARCDDEQDPTPWTGMNCSGARGGGQQGGSCRGERFGQHRCVASA